MQEGRLRHRTMGATVPVGIAIHTESLCGELVATIATMRKIHVCGVCEDWTLKVLLPHLNWSSWGNESRGGCFGASLST